MGFKEDLEKDREQKEKQSRERAYYKKVCQEVPYINLNENICDADKFYEDYYKNSLKVNLSPQQQKIVDEAIEFLEGWQSLPTEIDEKKVYLSIGSAMVHSTSELDTKVIRKNGYSNYTTVGWERQWKVSVGINKNIARVAFKVKHKWSDGSIHYVSCVLPGNDSRVIYSKDLGKLFIEQTIKRIMQEMKTSYLQNLQRKLNIYGNNHMKDGSQEYILLGYGNRDMGYDRSILLRLCIFRDGTVFDNGDFFNLYKNHDYLYEFLLKKIKKTKEGKYLQSQSDGEIIF